MPRLPDFYLDCAFFLYRSEEDARAGRDPQGTGFLIARPSKLYPEKQIVLAVSNHHVVCGETGASVIRLMKLDGTPDPIALGPEDWFYDPAGPDVMIACLTTTTSLSGVSRYVKSQRAARKSVIAQVLVSSLNSSCTYATRVLRKIKALSFRPKRKDYNWSGIRFHPRFIAFR